MTKTAKQCAKEILQAYKGICSTGEELLDIIRSKGFQVIFYRPLGNEYFTEELIRKLKLERQVADHDSFIYLSRCFKLVFIKEGLPESEKYALLCHELGHICDPDFSKSEQEYSKIKREEFANTFSFYLQHSGKRRHFCSFTKRKRAVCILIGFFLILCVACGIAANRFAAARAVNRYGAEQNQYYVTPSGKKYHRKFCSVIKGRTNLTEYTREEARELGYSACLFCIGEDK